MEPISKKPRIEAISSIEKKSKVESILGEYILTEDRIQQIVNAFEQQASLANSTDETEKKKSDLFWECTYVTKLLTGKENGEYLGLDLGGTNFRVVRAKFTDGTAETTTKYYNLSKELLTGPVEGVFDHIAESMEKFLKEENIVVNKPIPVGFTFSFPSVQKSLKNSILTTWIKCFKCTNGIGSDPCIMLEEAIQRRGEEMSQTVMAFNKPSTVKGFILKSDDVRCRVSLWRDLASTDIKTGDFVSITNVVVNQWNKEMSLSSTNSSKVEGLSVPVDIITRLSDTTATLMAGNYEDKNCIIGMIIGTGSNACFVEHISNFKKLDTDEIDAKQILVNTEWGAFSDGGCLDFMKTDLDKELDQHSNHVGSFTFEKMFSGLYLGELVRLVLAKMTSEGLLFKGTGSPQLFQRFNFDTKYVTAIESDEGSSDGNTRHILKQLGLESVSTDEDVGIVREVCEVISQRGAFCIAAATVVLLRHVNKPEVTIAVDGSLFEHHPKYKKHMSYLLQKLVPETKVKFILVKDGSGSGAAFVAAAESQQ